MRLRDRPLACNFLRPIYEALRRSFMRRQVYQLALPALLLASVAIAQNPTAAAKDRATESTNSAASERVQSENGERSSNHGLSTVLRKGADMQGLTMQEKWDEDVIVCKRTQVTGSRLVFKLCHTRGEWQAMRSNSGEILDNFKGARDASDR